MRSYFKYLWTGYKKLDEDKKLFIGLCMLFAFCATVGHTYVFIKKTQFSKSQEASYLLKELTEINL